MYRYIPNDRFVPVVLWCTLAVERVKLIFPLFLQELLKYSKGCEGSEDLQEALSSILGILKAVNDSMHLIAITGYEVSSYLSKSYSSELQVLN